MIVLSLKKIMKCCKINWPLMIIIFGKPGSLKLLGSKQAGSSITTNADPDLPGYNRYDMTRKEEINPAINLDVDGIYSIQWNGIGIMI